MPVSQHCPKKKHLPTPLLLGTILSHPWEAMPGTSPKNPKLNNSLPPGGNELAWLLCNWQAQKVMQSLSEAWEGGRELGLSKSASKWAPRQCVCVCGGGGSLRNCLIYSPTCLLVLCCCCQWQRLQAHCELHTNPEPYSGPRGKALH